MVLLEPDYTAFFRALGPLVIEGDESVPLDLLFTVLLVDVVNPIRFEATILSLFFTARASLLFVFYFMPFKSV